MSNRWIRVCKRSNSSFDIGVNFTQCVNDMYPAYVSDMTSTLSVTDEWRTQSYTD